MIFFGEFDCVDCVSIFFLFIFLFCLRVLLNFFELIGVRGLKFLFIVFREIIVARVAVFVAFGGTFLYDLMNEEVKDGLVLK